MTAPAHAAWLLWTSQGYDVPLTVCEALVVMTAGARHPGDRLYADLSVAREWIAGPPEQHHVVIMQGTQARPLTPAAVEAIRCWVRHRYKLLPESLAFRRARVCMDKDDTARRWAQEEER